MYLELRDKVCHLQRLVDVGLHSAELNVFAFGARRLHQAHQRAQAAAVDEVDVIEFENDVSILGQRVSDEVVER